MTRTQRSSGTLEPGKQPTPFLESWPPLSSAILDYGSRCPFLAFSEESQKHETLCGMSWFLNAGNYSNCLKHAQWAKQNMGSRWISVPGRPSLCSAPEPPTTTRGREFEECEFWSFRWGYQGQFRADRGKAGCWQGGRPRGLEQGPFCRESSRKWREEWKSQGSGRKQEGGVEGEEGQQGPSESY